MNHHRMEAYSRGMDRHRTEVSTHLATASHLATVSLNPGMGLHPRGTARLREGMELQRPLPDNPHPMDPRRRIPANTQTSPLHLLRITRYTVRQNKVWLDRAGGYMECVYMYM